jgi:hypothetical protein
MITELNKRPGLSIGWKSHRKKKYLQIRGWGGEESIHNFGGEVRRKETIRKT